MCQTADNSLKGNLEAQMTMLRSGVVALDQMPGLMSKAEDAERIYRTLMENKGWSPEQLFEITGYRIISQLSPINH